MRNPEVIYFEGLPGSGKTSLTDLVSVSHSDVFKKVSEYVVPVEALEASVQYNQRYFQTNDELKYKLARECGKTCLVDRGHLSTVLYSLAYNRIRGDQDLSYIIDWYFDRILKERMLPDRYIYLDISPETSLARRARSLDWDNMWEHKEALIFARENYPILMQTYESEIPVYTLNSDSQSLPEMQKKIVVFLASDNRTQGYIDQ